MNNEKTLFRLRAGIVGKDKTVSVYCDMPVKPRDNWINLDPGVYTYESLLCERMLIVVKNKSFHASSMPNG